MNKREKNALRKGNRDAELQDKTGWTAIDKPHKTIKTYNRNSKHKKLMSIIL